MATFAAGTKAKSRLARRFEAAGIASFEQAKQALLSGDDAHVAQWKAQLHQGEPLARIYDVVAVDDRDDDEPVPPPLGSVEAESYAKACRYALELFRLGPGEQGTYVCKRD